MIKKKLWKRISTILLAGGCALAASTTAHADIGAEMWQQIYAPTSQYHQGYFSTVGFNTDGSVLASGFRSEADSGTAIGIRYNAASGAVLDTPPEWFFFEYSWGDYTQDRFFDQHIDSSGNIYFVGLGYAASWNSFRPRYNVPNIWKYDSSYDNPVAVNPDRPLWRNYYIGVIPGEYDVHSMGQYNDMAVDSSDNIYAVGWYDDNPTTSGNRDWIIDKYASDGTRATGFPLIFDKDGLHDYAYAVATDSEDSFIVVGSVLVDAATDHYDWVVRKYNSSGALLWETSYDFSGGHDQAFSIVVDSDNNVIVSGYRSKSAPVVESDWYMVKYAKDGDGSGGASVLWEQFWDDGNAKNGAARGMLLDDRDNIYIIGYQFKDSTSPVYSDRYRPVLQYRYGDTGNLLYLQDIQLIATTNNKPASEHDYLLKLALDGDQLAIAGYTQQDDPTYLLNYAKTARVVMLELASDVDVMLRDKAAKWLGKRKHGTSFIPPTTNSYLDVEDADYNAGWIEQIKLDGISVGCDSAATLYCPKDPVTKTQAVKLVLKAAGESANPSPGSPPYDDVPTNHPDVGWIDRAKELGVTTGCDASNFCPDEVMTEKSFLEMLNRAY